MKMFWKYVSVIISTASSLGHTESLQRSVEHIDVGIKAINVHSIRFLVFVLSTN